LEDQPTHHVGPAVLGHVPEVTGALAAETNRMRVLHERQEKVCKRRGVIGTNGHLCLEFGASSSSSIRYESGRDQPEARRNPRPGTRSEKE